MAKDEATKPKKKRKKVSAFLREARSDIKKITWPSFKSWYIVRNIRGVTGFVGPGSKPVPLTEKEIESLGIDKKVVEISFDVGDSLKITDGPLEGFIGTVEEIEADKSRVKLIVHMFGKETPVELELTQVEVL